MWRRNTGASPPRLAWRGNTGASRPDSGPVSGDESWKERLHRWISENVADTRDAGGPAGRLYAAPFAGVWDALLDQVRERRRWQLAHQDEELGLITVRCPSLVFRFVDDLTIWVKLDEDGMTRVDARSASRVGKGDLGVNRRRLVRLFRTLDEQVGPETRLRARGNPRGRGLPEPVP